MKAKVFTFFVSDVNLTPLAANEIMRAHSVKEIMPVLPYRATPVPLAAVALLLTLWLLTSTSGSITRAQCDTDLEELIGEIETNRETALRDIAAQLATASIPQEKQSLLELREHIWDQEEQQRGQANHIWRDCMKAVREKKI